MNKKYETMAKFNMSMVRYFADKCGTIGLFDTYDCNFRPLDFSESDLNLWKIIAAFRINQIKYQIKRVKGRCVRSPFPSEKRKNESNMDKVFQGLSCAGPLENVFQGPW